MMMVRRSEERGRGQHGWLDSRHTFSFANYYDSEHMGFSVLRVINEDQVAPGAGFPTHGHRDMEIISYVVDGALEHKDSLGTGSVIRPGEVQRMSAGSGVSHSEYNASRTEPVHFLQIWVLPAEQGIEPGYEQRAFPEVETRGRWRLVASPDGEQDSVTVHQDVRFYVTRLAAGEALQQPLAADRRAWLHVVRGEVNLDGEPLAAGDGVAIADESELRLQAIAEAEVLLFDLP